MFILLSLDQDVKEGEEEEEGGEGTLPAGWEKHEGQFGLHL